MTPIEIFEYKMKWKPKGHIVSFHSDWEYDVKSWLKRKEKHTWIWNEYTDVYEHSVLFESVEDKDSLISFLEHAHPRAITPP